MKKYIVLCSLILMHTTTTNTMNAATQFISKGVTGISTLVHCGYFAPYMLNAVPLYKYSDYFARPTDEKTKKFVKDVLTQAEYPKHWVENVNIMFANPGFTYVYAALNNCILVPLAFDEKFKQEKNNESQLTAHEYPPPYIQRKIEYEELDKKLDPKTLADYLTIYGVEAEPYKGAQGILVHEAGHVFHNHPLKTSLVTLFSVLAVHTGAKKLAQYTTGFCSRFIQNQNILSLCKSAVRLGIGLPLKIAATLGILTLEHRRREKEADQELINRIKDPEVFEKVAQSFEALDKYALMRSTEKYGNSIENYPRLANFLYDPNHPRALDRADRFYKQAEELRKIQNVQKTIKNL